MIYEKIDSLIAGAMTLTTKMMTLHGKDSQHHKDAVRSLNFYREVKTELINATKGDEKNPGIKLPNDEAELAILKAMYDKRKSAIKKFEKAGNDPLAMEAIETNKYEMSILESFLPKKTGADEVIEETKCIIKTFVELKSIEDPSWNGLLMPHMKHIIAKVKEKYPDAENGVIAAVVKSYK